MGGERARLAAERLLDGGAERLLVWGVAGALEPDLAPGTLVLPRKVWNDRGEAYEPDLAWRASLLEQIPKDIIPSEGALATVTRPVSGREAKRVLAREHEAVAVDMETAAIARLAVQRKAPFAVVRAIADPLELTLPRVVTSARSERFMAAEVLLRLLARPRDMAGLKALSHSMRAARQSLTRYARRLAAPGQASRLY